MPRGSKTKPNNALSAALSPSLARGWYQRIHHIAPDLDASDNKLAAPDSDHLKVMMQTRVAVRDKTPHRFQIVPLREVSNLGLDQTELSTRLNVPSTPMNKLHRSPSGPYSQTRTLHSISPTLNQSSEEGGDVQKPVVCEDRHCDSPREPLITKLDRTPRPVAADPPHFRRVLAELDLNRDTGVSMATAKCVLKPITSGSLTMRSLPSRDLLTSFSHTEPSIIQATPHASAVPRDEQHHPLTFHISQISQLFSSENVAPLPPTRRNRSMTISSIPSDASVGMSDMSHEPEAKLKRRHAIYRESSCIPYMGKPQEKNLVGLDDNFSIPVLGTHRDLSNGINKGINFDEDGCSTESSGPLLQPPFELKQTFAGRPRTPYFSSSRVDGLMPVRPLKLLKSNHVSRRTPANTAHSQIVLDLLRDIDEAIGQWAQP